MMAVLSVRPGTATLNQEDLEMFHTIASFQELVCPSQSSVSSKRKYEDA